MSRWAKALLTLALAAIFGITGHALAQDDLFSILLPDPTPTAEAGDDLFSILIPQETPAPDADDLFSSLIPSETEAPTAVSTPEPTPEPTPELTPAPARLTRVNVARRTAGGEPAQGALLTPADRIVAENSRVGLYLDETSFTVKALIRETGFVFSSAPAEEKLASLNEEWKRLAHSVAFVEYLNASGTVSRSSMWGEGADPVEYSDIENGFEARVHFPEAGVRMTLRFILTEDGFAVEVDRDSIVEEKSVYLSRVVLLPFFGAAYGDELSGYALVPDGCGALIDFTSAHSYIGSYTARVYGRDYGAVRAAGQAGANVGAMDLNMPLFGMVHGADCAAYLAVCAKGEAYMSVEVDPAGVTTPFTRACCAFVYRESYSQSTGASTMFLVIPPELNDLDVRMEYSLLWGQDADYSGMARAYRQRLIDGGILERRRPEGPVPLLLRVLMAESEKSVLGTQPLVMTTLSQTEAFAQALQDARVGRVDVSLIGYAPGGATRQKLGSTAVWNRIGGRAGLESLKSAVSGKVYLEENVITGYESQIERRYLAYSTDGGLISQRQADKPLENTRYWQNLTFIQRALYEPAEALALADAGNQLHSDQREGRVVSREGMREGIAQTLLEASSQRDIALLMPYAYAFGGMDAVMEAPMTHSQYAYEHEAVPFYQMVLSGCVEMYASAMNYESQHTRGILRLVDYGVCPAFIVTEKSASALSMTNTTDIYSSRFSDWEEDMTDVYAQVNEALSAIRGRAILRRTAPEEDVVRCEYEDGVLIYINYNEEAREADGLTLEPLSVTVLEGDEER